MKKLFQIMLLISLLSTNVYALNLKEGVKFAGGALTSYMIHEGGHYFAAEVTNNDMEWEFMKDGQLISFYSNPESDHDGLYINSAGLVSQAIMSEIIIDSKLNNDDFFVRGMMFWNVLNPIMYAVDYWWLKRTNEIKDNTYFGDLAGIEYYSDKKTANIFAGTMVLLALWHGHRFCSEETTNFNLMPIKDGVGLNFTYRF